MGIRGTWGSTQTQNQFSYRYAQTYSSATAAANASDIRLKTNITPCEIKALDVINKINTYSFDWKVDNRGHQAIGFVADYLENVDSNLVSGGGYNDSGDMIYKSINTFYL